MQYCMEALEKAKFRAGKIVLPGEIEDLAGILAGDLLGAVRTARVRDDDLVYQVPDGIQTAGQVLFLVFDDHAEADSDQYDHPFGDK